MRIFLSFVIACIGCTFSVTALAQQQEDTFDLDVRVFDKHTKEPLEYAFISLAGGNHHRETVCNDEGKAVIGKLPVGKYRLAISLLGYKKWEEEMEITDSKSVNVALVMDSNELNEVVVTASESKGLTSSSIIDKKAMQHLQPSSFTDLLELLPGGRAMDPKFNEANLISIREVDRPEKYSVSSLGTSFVMDGTPVSTDANMQYLPSGDIFITGTSGNTDRWRNTVNKGVDMRAIPTDQIEKVEIVRGIPSVQYGDLTSGLVRIERKKGMTPWEARLKVDGYSKLFAFNKGFDFRPKKLTLNVGLDYMNSNNNPTNSYEGYRRITYSSRLGKIWNKQSFGLSWQSNFDYAHTLDEVKVDPNIYDNVQAGADLESLKKNQYTSKYDRLSFTNTFRLTPKEKSFLKFIDLNASSSYEMDKIEQCQFVQLNTLALTIPTQDEGIADGIYLPNKYLSYQNVDGNPLTVFLQGKAGIEFVLAKMSHKIVLGGEYTFDKNYGDGQVIDKYRPPGGQTYRPRKYSDIPDKQNLNWFFEDVMSMPIGRNLLKLNVGVRGMSMVDMDKRYEMSRKQYLDPRINAEWRFPAIEINSQDLNISLSGGVGWHSKFPTLNQIYPDYIYRDYVRMNYYNVNDPEYSRVNYETFKSQHINYKLEPARNRKWEIRLNMHYDQFDLSVTYFREKMINGFRNEIIDFLPVTTSRYYNDKDSVVIDPVTHQPDLDQSKYKVLYRLHANSATNNGSRIDKEGVEFTFSTKRFESLKTRMTITGAWFRNQYLINGEVYKRPSIQINGESIQDYGIYDSSGGECNERFNTNFMLDTYIPLLGFEFSTSFQCLWFDIFRNLPESPYPFAYIDVWGEKHPYTEADKTDPALQFMRRESNPGLYATERIPFGMAVNLKASKKIKDIARISLFVNKLLDYYPDYEVNGAVIKRNVSPYFGMELSFTL